MADLNELDELDRKLKSKIEQTDFKPINIVGATIEEHEQPYQKNTPISSMTRMAIQEHGQPYQKNKNVSNK